MICVSCGKSAVGIGLDGRSYCEQKACFDWKTDLIKGRQLRQESQQRILREHSARQMRIADAVAARNAFAAPFQEHAR